ncbi:uncharacterized protein BJ171DRAFT_482299 [Polychytrium aggregatum]|uniref:uncharacterized protein n=1 Tax=Polychytrium aggregatum TaxID=110093 RepID=UPI0022FEFEC7|nr:uncharacterized protein BJ171DRAFT_482299 [Polychytrium aggregatum]KAI9190685.1 hypothetical protein BJ171DRAFT_482299 [Polychytrium aggregatum]
MPRATSTKKRSLPTDPAGKQPRQRAPKRRQPLPGEGVMVFDNSAGPTITMPADVPAVSVEKSAEDTESVAAAVPTSPHGHSGVSEPLNTDVHGDDPIIASEDMPENADAIPTGLPDPVTTPASDNYRYNMIVPFPDVPHVDTLHPKQRVYPYREEFKHSNSTIIYPRLVMKNTAIVRVNTPIGFVPAVHLPDHRVLLQAQGIIACLYDKFVWSWDDSKTKTTKLTFARNKLKTIFKETPRIYIKFTSGVKKPQPFVDAMGYVDIVRKSKTDDSCYLKDAQDIFYIGILSSDLSLEEISRSYHAAHHRARDFDSPYLIFHQHKKFLASLGGNAAASLREAYARELSSQ